LVFLIIVFVSTASLLVNLALFSFLASPVAFTLQAFHVVLKKVNGIRMMLGILTRSPKLMILSEGVICSNSDELFTGV